MNTLSAYLAAADDLTSEFADLMELASHLNKIYNSRGLQLDVIPHKPSMEDLEKCKICLTLYCSKFGNYTQENFEATYVNQQKVALINKTYIL